MRGVLAQTSRKLSFRPRRAAVLRSAVLTALQCAALLLLAIGAAPRGPQETTIVVLSSRDLAGAEDILSDFDYQVSSARTADGSRQLLTEPRRGFGVDAAATDIVELLAELPVLVVPRVYLDPQWTAPDSSAARLGGLTALAATGVLLLGAVRGVAEGAGAERRRLRALGLTTAELRLLFFLQAGWIGAPATGLSLLLALVGRGAVPGLISAWLSSVLVLGGLSSVSAMILARRELGGGLYRTDRRP